MLPNRYESINTSEEILSDIESCLKRYENVYFKMDNFTFLCEAYIRHGLVEFLINVFQDSEKNTRIIEFQHRKGDAYAFCSVVRCIKSQLHNLISIPSSDSSQWKDKAKAKADAILSSSRKVIYNHNNNQLPPLKVNPESVRSSIKHMFDMSKPGGDIGDIDIRSESLRTIADMSEERMAQDIIANSEENLQDLFCCVYDENVDIHRLATTILAKVCHLIDFSSLNINISITNITNILKDRISNSSSSKVVTESARALKILMNEN